MNTTAMTKKFHTPEQATELLTLQCLDLRKRVDELDVASSEAYEEGSEILRAIAGAVKQVEVDLGPGRDAAYRTHKILTTKIASYIKPYRLLRVAMEQKLRTYHQEQERIARAEQARLEKLAREAEEARQLERAAALEQDGRAEEAQAVIDQRVQTPVVRVAPAVPKVQGVSTTARWKHEVVDPSLVPDKWKVINDTALAQHARSLKKLAKVPGVRFYEDESYSVTGG